MQVMAFAIGTLAWSRRAVRDFTGALAIRTLEFTHFYGTSFYVESLALDQGLSYFLARGFHDAAESLPGYVHAPGGFLLVQPFKVRKSEGLEFAQGEHDFSGTLGRSKAPAARHAGYSSPTSRSGHN
jgi:hypothetical protein